MALTQATYDAALAIQHRAQEAENRIATNLDLTVEARQRAIAANYVAARAEMDQLRERATGVGATRVAELERQLFGVADLPGDVATNAISSRDAMDRASALDNAQEAADLLDRAQRTGDEILARAITARAFELIRGREISMMNEQWGEVFNAYFETHPGRVNLGQELIDLTNAPTSAAEMFAFVLAQPSELAGLSDHVIQSMAAAGAKIRGASTTAARTSMTDFLGNNAS